ncbi:MAG: M14 family metallopeptidase [Candidatus Omnitrophota bacterium]
MIVKSLRPIILAAILFAATQNSFSAEATKNYFPALGAPAERKVEVAWNRFYDTKGLEDILKRIQKAYPQLTKLYSIGESYEGRTIWCLELTNREKGDPARKAGMYIDGNIHGNEVQAGEVVMYTAWYLCESYGKVEKVTQLLDDRVFYLIPTINPDGRDNWFHNANTAHSSRSGLKPLDNDRDGLVDEDGYDDLNGDGVITMMRIRDSNGRWKPHPDYPEFLMIRAKPDERGEYDLLGDEGIDNDGDGRVNEDGPGGYDSNRNWAYDWQPPYVQYGSIEFPFSLPNTQAVARFVIAHPNIASGQSYHNAAGMILRSPGREGGAMTPQDDRVMAEIGRKGERMLPFYRSLVCWSGLYPVWGGEFDWFYGARGIYCYTNELWTPRNMFRDGGGRDEDDADFLRYLTMEQGIVKWQACDHPTYGKIEIGGTAKEFSRTPPSFLLEEECHRNMAFTLYNAEMMPKIQFGDVSVESLGGDLYKVWVEVRNEGMIPTRSGQDVNHSISTPDVISLEGKNVRVLSGGRVTDRYFKRVDPVEVRPHRVEIPAIGGLDSERAQFVVKGKGEVAITADSVKGGLIRKTIELK